MVCLLVCWTRLSHGCKQENKGEGIHMAIARRWRKVSMLAGVWAVIIKVIEEVKELMCKFTHKLFLYQAMLRDRILMSG